MQIGFEVDKKAIGSRLRNERIRCSYTQEKLAEIMGVTSKYLSKIENGMASPSLPYVLKFSEITESDLNYLLLGRYTRVNDREGLLLEPAGPYDGPDIKLSRRNRRICHEITKRVADVLEEWNR